MYSSRWGIQGSDKHEGSALTPEVSTRIQEEDGAAWSLLLLQSHEDAQPQATIYGAVPDIQFACTLILGFPASRTLQNIILSFIN